MTATVPSPDSSDETALAGLTSSVGHYENFPVASLLTPPRLRPAIRAIYRFARVADDIADEGAIPAGTRLETLVRYRQALDICSQGSTYRHDAWKDVFGPLALVVHQYHLPVHLLHDLLSAFEQDVRYTAEGRLYTDASELLDYCACSANPVGRLLLHLYDVKDPESLQQSDQICSALQLINFWQDIREDALQQRYYLPRSVLESAGIGPQQLPSLEEDTPSAMAMERAIEELCMEARAMMMTGAPLALRLPGRIGWELRLVIQGGIRILDRIRQLQYRTWQSRPTLKASDLPVMAWRSLLMRSRHR